MVNKVIYESNSWTQLSAPGAASAVCLSITANAYPTTRAMKLQIIQKDSVEK